MLTTLTDVFKDQFAKSKLMDYDYQTWKRKRADDPEKTFHYLRQLMENQMLDDQTERNKVAQMKAHEDKSKGYDPLFGGFGGGGGGKRRPAAPATEKGGGRGRGKGTKNPYGPGNGGAADGKGRPNMKKKYTAEHVGGEQGVAIQNALLLLAPQREMQVREQLRDETRYNKQRCEGEAEASLGYHCRREGKSHGRASGTTTRTPRKVAGTWPRCQKGQGRRRGEGQR